MTEAVLIVKVLPTPTRTLGRTLWKITDSSSTVYATYNSWLASLAEQYRLQDTPVFISSCAGWNYRDLIGISPAKAKLLPPDPPVISHAEFFERR
jgi:hypothetical protein